MPFGVVSGIGLGMGVLDFGGDRRGEGAVSGVNLRRPIVTKIAAVAAGSLRRHYHDLDLSAQSINRL